MLGLESLVNQAGRLPEFRKPGRITPLPNVGLNLRFVVANWRSRSTLASLDSMYSKEPLLVRSKLSRSSSLRIFSALGLFSCTSPSRLIPKRPSPCSIFANENIVDKVNPNNMNTNRAQSNILFPLSSRPREPAAKDSMVSFRDWYQRRNSIQRLSPLILYLHSYFSWSFFVVALPRPFGLIYCVFGRLVS